MENASERRYGANRVRSVIERERGLRGVLKKGAHTFCLRKEVSACGACPPGRGVHLGLQRRVGTAAWSIGAEISPELMLCGSLDA